MAFDEVEENTKYYFIILVLSCTFIILPLMANITQLWIETKKWKQDSLLRKTGVTKWLQTHLQVLYLISVISGSCFSAVALCNSYMLKLRVFSMGLSKYHTTFFQAKRFMSVILLENIPQLILQICTLALAIKSKKPITDSLITFLSMFFTIVSILLSGIELLFSSHSIESDINAQLIFEVTSSKIGNMRESSFSSNIKYQPKEITRCISKTLEIDPSEVERLLPLQTKKGCTLSFIVGVSDMEDLDRAKTLLDDAIYNNELRKELHF